MSFDFSTCQPKPVGQLNKSAGYKPRRLLPYLDTTITDTRGGYKYVRAQVLPLVENLSRTYQVNLLTRFSKLFEDVGYFEALKDLKDLVAPVTKVLKLCPFDDLTLLHDEVKRHDVADNMSNLIKERLESFSRSSYCREHEYEDNAKKAYQFICSIVETYKINLPYNPSPRRKEGLFVSEAESGLLRFTDSEYWEKQFDSISKKTNEHIAIALGHVRKKFSPYVSKHALTDYRSQLEQNKNYLNAMEVVNTETGDTQSLAELAKLGSADPEKRRIELMVRCRGLEDLALKQGREAVFLTITAPSKYHKNSNKWNLSSPRQTSDYLVNVWAKTRAELARFNDGQGIDYCGVRVSEPHCDATPHWHVLLFVEPSQRDELINICRDYATEDDKDELMVSWARYLRAVKNKKAKSFRKSWHQPRFDFEIIDPEKGSATGYIAKYISKNINGSKMEGQLDDDAEIKVDESAQRVTAWASLWGIRQFQFFGAASVTVWRECRRAKEPFKSREMELCRQAADKGDWQEFTESMQKHRLVICYEDTDERNAYNEKLVRVKGLKLSDKFECTRPFSFDLKKRCLSLPWSPVINCTENNSETINNRIQTQNTSYYLEKMGFVFDEIQLLSQGKRISSGDGFIYWVENGELREKHQKIGY